MNKLLARRSLVGSGVMSAVGVDGADAGAGAAVAATHPALAAIGAGQEGVQTRLLTTPVFYKAFEVGSKGQIALAELVSSGKLTMADIDVVSETDDATKLVRTTWKRKGAKLEVAVPVLTGLVAGLTANQQQHLQELVEKYMTDKQRPLFDSLDGKYVNWIELLEGSFSQRKVTVKITAEMVKAACVALTTYLQVPEKAKATAVAMADKKFSSAVTRNTKPEVLDKLLTLILEAAAAYEEAVPAEFAAHAPVFELWANNIQEALQPADEESLSLDDLIAAEVTEEVTE